MDLCAFVLSAAALVSVVVLAFWPARRWVAGEMPISDADREAYRRWHRDCRVSGGCPRCATFDQWAPAEHWLALGMNGESGADKWVPLLSRFCKNCGWCDLFNAGLLPVEYRRLGVKFESRVGGVANLVEEPAYPAERVGLSGGTPISFESLNPEAPR